MSCKVCKVANGIPGAQELLLTKPSREAAKALGVSKTSVNDHRNKCMGISVAKVAEPKDEMQEIIWNGNTGELRTGALQTELSGLSPEEILRSFGHDPDRVQIVGVIRERHSEYYNRDAGKKLWKHSYSYAIKRIDKADEQVDPIALMKELGLPSRAKGINTIKGESSTFVLDWADWQVAKKEGGGSAGFVERFDSAMKSSLNRIVELRTLGRKLNELVIIGGGDIVEGCTIYAQQSFHIDGHRRDQIRLAVATILKGIYALAPHFDSVRVVVVPGNHGENRINGNRTSIGDNDDLLVFDMAETAIDADGKMKHVKFEIAEEEVSVATKIQGWTYGITHGDVYGRGGGTGVRNKVFGWFKTMAANRHAVGAADVLVTHHFHHDALEDWGATLWVQNPTMDGGSAYFVEATGHKPKHGMNSWVVTQAERFQDKQILR